VDIDNILKVIQDSVAKASKEKTVQDLTDEVEDKLASIDSKLKSFNRPIGDIIYEIINKSQEQDSNTEVSSYVEDDNNESHTSSDSDDESVDKDNNDNSSQSFDYTAYRERLDQYVKDEREQELEEGGGPDGYDSDGLSSSMEDLLNRTTVCIGNDIEQAASGYSLDGVYTSQLSYINGKRWYKLTSPSSPGDEFPGDTTIKFKDGNFPNPTDKRWRIENTWFSGSATSAVNQGYMDGALYVSKALPDINPDEPTPDLIKEWLDTPGVSGYFPGGSALNVYSCPGILIPQHTYEFNFTYSSFEVYDQIIHNPDPHDLNVNESIPWTIVLDPENNNTSVTVEFDFSGSAESDDILIDPLGVGSTISSNIYTYTAEPNGNGFSEFRVIRDALSANTDGDETFYIRFVSGSDATGQFTVSGGSVSAVLVTIKD
jgi:hypothetical protein